MSEHREHVPLPRIELGSAQQRQPLAALRKEHRRAIQKILKRHPELRVNLALLQALEDQGLNIIAVPNELAGIAHDIGYALALRDRISEIERGSN